MEKRSKKVVLGLSGGADSSVAGFLLKKKGFDVLGVFMRLADTSGFKEAEKKARKTAKILGIEFSVLDLRKEFNKTVIEYFLKEYKNYRTPNPCVVCNKDIKFRFLIKEASKLKADFIATGHYVRFEKGKLLKGKDKTKDQSYFLWRLCRKDLKKALFPLGEYRKQEVKRIADKLRLPAAKASESQEICFLSGDVRDFLKKNLKNKQGKIVDAEGNVLGEHEGICFYTIGQRKGIKLPGGPYFVAGFDIKKNNLIVSKNQRDLLKKYLIAKKVNWVSGRAPKLPIKVLAKIRYGAKLTSAVVGGKGSGIEVLFSSSQRAVTSGQSVVFWKKEELLGGGVIV